MNVGETLKRTRIAAGLRTAKELADASGVGLSVIQNIESGRKKDISLIEVVAFCRALGVPASHFAPELLEVEEMAVRKRDAAQVSEVVRAALETYVKKGTK